MRPLEGKVAIVTGGSRGYGAGIAEALAGEGAAVWITGRTAADLRPAGARASCIIPSWGPTDFARAAGQEPFDRETAARCIQPIELGGVVVEVCCLPDHFAIPELVLLPLVQNIEPL